MGLLEQRQAVIDRHKLLEKTRGSGWHPADLGAHEREQKNELPLSERPVAIHDDDRMYFVGPCVAVVKNGLTSFIAAIESDPEKDLIGNSIQFQKRVAKNVKRMLEQDGDTLAIPAYEWNSISAALAVSGIQCVMIGVEE